MAPRGGIAAVACACGLAVLSAALAAPGQLDLSFGSGGKVTTDLGSADWAGSVALAPSGGLVVAGGSGNDVALVRYDATGHLDRSVVTDLGGFDAAGGVLVQPDGKIVLAVQRDGALGLLRYSAVGVLDPSFDGDGITVQELGFDVRAVEVLRQLSGRLIAVGGSPGGAVLARYLPDGRPDASFGRSGVAVLRTPGTGWEMAVQAHDGTIVVAGKKVVTRPAEASALALARFRPDGRLDRTFAGDGVTVTRLRPHWAGAIKLGVRRDGRIVVGTHGHAGARQGFALVQFRRDGSIDRSFGDGGTAVVGVGFGVHALALDDRGRIVTVGRTKSLLDWIVARFLSNGRLDRSFATTVADFGGVDTPFALVLQRDGKPVAVGSSATGGGLTGQIVVARFLATG